MGEIVKMPQLGEDGNSTSEKPKEEVEVVKENMSEKIPEVKIDTTETSTQVTNNRDQKLSPIVRKLAKENNINLSQVSGTGKDNRITRKDIEKILDSGEVVKPQEKEVKNEISEPINSEEPKKRSE